MRYVVVVFSFKVYQVWVVYVTRYKGVYSHNNIEGSVRGGDGLSFAL